MGSTNRSVRSPDSSRQFGYGSGRRVAVTVPRYGPEWEEMLVEGHCDSRASDAYNLDLSQRRASSVQKFLLARGIEP